MIEFASTVDVSRPTRAVLGTSSEVAAACLALIRAARRSLRCLHRDLSVFNLATSTAAGELEKFLLGHRNARIRLLVDELDWLETRAPRLRLLQRQFSHALEVRVATSEDPIGDDSWMEADGSHVLSLGQSAHGIGELWLANEPRAQVKRAAFDRRWDAAAHNIPIVPLGL